MINITTEKLLELNISMTSQRDGEQLLENILEEAMDITNCDGGTVYILDNNALEFKVMITRSLSIHKRADRDEIDLPPAKLDRYNVCARSVLENKLITIDDVYHDIYQNEPFDFSGPMKYDKITGYKTTSMMVVPMENNKGEIIGVMQLLNAQDENGVVGPFDKEGEKILRALASQAAICLTNMNFLKEISELMESMVRTMSSAIYLRTPYNVTHTSNMVRRADKFIDWLNNSKHTTQYFDDNKKSMFLMSIWLHDIGKLVTPLPVMDKATRLGDMIDTVMTRLDMIALIRENEGLKNGEDISKISNEMEVVKNFLHDVNQPRYQDEYTINYINEIGSRTFTDRSGKVKTWLTAEEVENLCIVTGTLTKKERAIMQDHVVMTSEILRQMNFKGAYQQVPIWAEQHHEFLDGSGYPNGLTAKELSFESRLLTILDIYDGLAAKDRPYKPAITTERVFSILDQMVTEGKLDGEILEMYKESKAWKED